MTREAIYRGDTDICLVSLGASVANLAAGRNTQAAGGAELQVARLTRLLSDAGLRVSLVASSDEYSEELARDMQGKGIRLVPSYQEGGIPYLRYFYATIPRFWGALKRANSSVYYLRGSSGFVGMTAEFCRRHGRRMIFAVSSDGDLQPELVGERFNWRDRALYRWGLQRADAVVVQTRVQQEELKRHWGIDGILIRSLYLRPESPPSDQPKEHVLWAGRARRVKRPDLFLELARRMPEHTFAMAGQREMPGEEVLCQTITEEAKSIPNLLFLGAVPFGEMASWYDRSWLFVNTSTTEGFPNTFLEAWDRGLPVVATVDPDRLLSEGGLGFVCKDVDEIAARIELLHRDRRLLAEIGERARAYVASEHQRDGIVSRYRNLIASLSAGVTGRPAAPAPDLAGAAAPARSQEGVSDASDH